MYQKITGSLVYSSTDTDKTFSYNAPHTNTHAVVLAVVVPNFTNAVTLTIKYKTDGAITLKTLAAIPRNDSTPISLELPFIDGCEIQGVLSGAPGTGGGTVNLYLYLGQYV